MAARVIRHDPGGSAGLVAALTEQWDAIEADFARYYRLDLTAACFGREQVGARRLLNLIRHLPRDSAFGRSADPDWWWWQPDHDYLAAAVETLRGVLESTERHRAAVVGRKFRQVSVERLHRPGDRRQTRHDSLLDALRRLGPGEVEYVPKEV